MFLNDYKYIMNNRLKWNLMYIEAKKYYETNGNLLVPYNYRSNNLDLGKWLSLLREKYKKNLLSLEKIQALNKIKMIWRPDEYKWNLMYEEAKNYFNCHGDLLVEESFVTSQGIKLGIWIVKERQAYLGKTSEHLSEEQIFKLEQIGMVWHSVADERWQKKYNIAKKFYLEHGFIPVSKEYLETYPEIYKWLRSQRNAYKAPGFSLAKLELLKEIGLVLETTSKREDIINYLRNLKNQKGIFIDFQLNKEVLYRLSLLELQSKINYLLSKNISPIDKDGKLIDIFTMSSVDILKDERYGVTLKYLITNFSKKKSLKMTLTP